MAKQDWNAPVSLRIGFAVYDNKQANNKTRVTVARTESGLFLSGQVVS